MVEGMRFKDGTFMLLKSGYFSQSLVIALHFLDSMRLAIQGEENPVNVLWLHFGLLPLAVLGAREIFKRRRRQIPMI